MSHDIHEHAYRTGEQASDPKFWSGKGDRYKRKAEMPGLILLSVTHGYLQIQWKSQNFSKTACRSCYSTVTSYGTDSRDGTITPEFCGFGQVT